MHGIFLLLLKWVRCFYCGDLHVRKKIHTIIKHSVMTLSFTNLPIVGVNMTNWDAHTIMDLFLSIILRAVESIFGGTEELALRECATFTIK